MCGIEVAGGDDLLSLLAQGFPLRQYLFVKVKFVAYTFGAAAAVRVVAVIEDEVAEVDADRPAFDIILRICKTELDILGLDLRINGNAGIPFLFS